MESNQKKGSMPICIASLLTLVCAGTFTGIASAVTVAIGRVVDISGFSAEELKEFSSEYIWLGEFSGEHAQMEYLSRNLIIIGVAVLVFLAALIVFCIQSVRLSKAGNSSTIMNLWDKVWTELQILLLIGMSGFAVSLAVPVFHLTPLSNWVGIMKPFKMDMFRYGINNNTLLGLCTAGIAVCILIAAISFVSLIRKIAAKKLISESLTGRIIRLVTAVARGAARKLSVPAEADIHAARKLIIKYSLIAVALILFPLVSLMLIFSHESVFIAVIISSAIAVTLIVRKVGKLSEIRAGVIEVKSGNLAHKIEVNTDERGPKTDLDQLASDINHISEATNAAVQNEIKNQRLKTDLISNVSHDLKTPLTSMISYLDILDKEGLESPDAPAHLAIVKEKTERLRTLTEELFEAAKASSGAIPCEIEDIDLAAIIDQSLAEMGDRLDKKNLSIRKSIKTDSALVRADGKLLYRVLENILSNIGKYALENSRVYIDVSRPASNAKRLLLEAKNISRDELNISPDELMERFTRGDSSRNTEGSGLGLAIAKDLTVLMGGVFEISIDGDMFKVSILLDEVQG